jgi:gluconolactonase
MILNILSIKHISGFSILIAAGLFFGCTREDGIQKIIQPGAALEKLSDGFLFTEGPSSDAAGNVCFTDQPNDRIMHWSISGEISVFMQPSGRSNGLAFDREGNLWACADEKTELWRISPDKTITVMVAEYQGKPLNGPNDLWISPGGGIYLTDPYYPRPWWTHTTMPQDCQGVYYFDPVSKILTRVADDLVQPNGIVGTPDGKTLYVADIGDNKTWSFRIDKDGSLTDKTLFCGLGSDGMALDVKGNLYLTGKGVTVFDKKGRQLGIIAVPESWTANVCFGGDGRKSLFITASEGVYRMPMRVSGNE